MANTQDVDGILQSGQGPGVPLEATVGLPVHIQTRNVLSGAFSQKTACGIHQLPWGTLCFPSSSSSGCRHQDSDHTSSSHMHFMTHVLLLLGRREAEKALMAQKHISMTRSKHLTLQIPRPSGQKEAVSQEAMPLLDP
ncbi:hypothetical protein P7K49_032558 [Saguinus oedipus]|uniref:Uncharacterized protein n=1 Tax=Saguinus oedipus TaxID=9490 RepID=A0ABQ9TYK5_SAGOE|nr:hypothetical protein P7K49_032558 [Saguinus oedipus]